MTYDPTRGRPPVLGQDGGPPPYHGPLSTTRSHDPELSGLLRQLVAGQDKQNELLEELIGQVGSNQRQKTTELGQWKKANPRLARNCRRAAEELSKVQAEFLENLTRKSVRTSITSSKASSCSPNSSTASARGWRISTAFYRCCRNLARCRIPRRLRIRRETRGRWHVPELAKGVASRPNRSR